MEDYKEKIINLYNKVRFSALLEDSLLAKKLEEAFPELKEETEDERISKELIKLLRNLFNNYSYFIKDPLYTECIAWLEKKAEQKPAEQVLSKEVESQIWQIANNAGITFEQSMALLEATKKAYDKGKADAINEQKPVDSMALSEDDFTPKDVFRFNLASCLYNYGKEVAAKCLDTHILDEELNDYVTNDDVNKAVERSVELLRKNVAEQKPVDEVKPKFKVGDIVKHKDNPHLTYILKRFTDDGDYEFHAIGKDGNEGGTCFSVVKYQDEWELVEQKTAWSENDEKMWLSAIEYIRTHPAQTRSVVEWLKSLKERVIPQSKQEWSEEDEKIYQSIMDDTVQENQLNSNQTNWLRDIKYRYFPQPKQEWNGVDKVIISRLIGICSKASSYGQFNGFDQDEIIECQEWLKALEDRDLSHLKMEWSEKVASQTKQEWNEEDEKCIKLSTSIINSALRAGFCVQLDRDRCVDWFKSLRPQSHWKPSEEQMENLSRAFNGGTYRTSLLMELYQELKKLRGE